MSNIAIVCKISLSKKLRALLGKDGSITLMASDLVNGIGNGRLSISSDTISASKIDISKMAETSIMLTPVEITDEMPEERVQSAIFTSVPGKGRRERVVSKIAAVNAPEKEEVPGAIVPIEEVETPEVFAETKDPECKKWISNMQELAEAVASAASQKKSTIDLNQAADERERAVLLEMREKEEAIDASAWIVNNKAGMLTINDLGISLPLNSPFDLSNISARRIICSKDFKALVKSGFIKFLTPKERDQLVMGLEHDRENESHGLTVFDDHDEAMGAMSGGKENPIISEENMMEVSEADVGRPTEEESTILNLTQNMPTTKTRSQVPVNTQPRRSTHGNPSNTSVKTIRRAQ